MLWVVLASVTSALPVPAKVASTYDEAACADELREKAVAPDGEGEPNCSEAPPPVPAVLDCNDPRVSLWLGEMMGSCDMPKPQLPGVVPAVRGANGDSRVCEDGRCGVDSSPIRPGQRNFDDLTPFLTARTQPLIFNCETPVELALAEKLSQHDRDRVERPPRSL